MPPNPHPSLEAGFTALKQGDYQTAKAILQSIAVEMSDDDVFLQAQVGLAVAYARCGEIAAAIATCEMLTQSNHLQIQQWAERSLADLTRYSHEQSVADTETGFVVFESPRVFSLPELPTFESKENEQTLPPPVTQEIPRPEVKRTPTKASKIHWRQAGRAKVWQPLPKFNSIPLRLLILGTFIAIFWLIRSVLMWVMGLINTILVKLPYVKPLQFLYSDPTWLLFLALVILLIASPWLLDWLFFHIYNLRELEKDSLNRYSKEAVRVLQRYCQQKHWRLPKLGVLPIMTPLALTYGILPRTARIIVTQGLLEQLEDDEIATIFAGELGHITYKDSVVMSLLLLITIPIYTLYQQLSLWGDAKQGKIWQLIATVITSITYGIWALLTGTGLWLSHLRPYYSDRVATDITGNPNGLVRALLKIAIGIADDIEKQGQTPWQLESLNIVIPVGYQQSLTLGSIARDVSWESLLMWDYLNPYRQWLTINNTHPLIGARLQRLGEIARHWHIEPQLYLNQQPLMVKPHMLLLQIAPFLGIPLGIIFAGLTWLIWNIAFALKVLNIKWIYDDWSFVIGCILIGCSIGILVRINYFFPDIKPSTVQTDERLPDLLANPTALPVNSMNVRLNGKLLGRRGVGNSLAQDFILQTTTGCVKLHHVPWLGQSLSPQNWVGRQVTVTGWLRRGATPWIDIETLQAQTGKSIHSPHPILSVVIAVIAEAWGAYILIRG